MGILKNVAGPDSPLGLPEGTVRAVIALMLIATSSTCYVMGRDVPETLWDATLITIGYYFGTRTKPQGR